MVKLGARRARSLTQLRGLDTHALCGPCIVRSMPDVVQGWDTSVRGTISKGRFVQGAQHPITFGQGHIGRGHINPASIYFPSPGPIHPCSNSSSRIHMVTFYCRTSVVKQLTEEGLIPPSRISPSPRYEIVFHLKHIIKRKNDK